MSSCLRKTFTALDSPGQSYDPVEVRNFARTHGFDLEQYHDAADFLDSIFNELSKKFEVFDTSGPRIQKATVCELCFVDVRLSHVNTWIFVIDHNAVDTKVGLLDSFWRFFDNNGYCQLCKTSYTFSAPPPVIICAIKNVTRAEDASFRVKNVIKVFGSITIDVDNVPHRYTVGAIVLHENFQGKNVVVSSYGCNFTCCVQLSNGTWFEIDDQRATAISIAQVRELTEEHCPSLVFYIPTPL